MEKIIYLDNAATTKPFKIAMDYYKKFSYINYFNPSSVHKGGIKCREIIEESREYFADLLKVKKDEIIFTSGATESNNTVIKGVGNNLKNGEYLLTTPIEHKSIQQSIKDFKHKKVDINPSGKIVLDDLREKLTSKTKLLSFILTNNETGIIQDYHKIIDVAKGINPDILIHMDTAQAFGKIITNIDDIDIDFLSTSGHKLHAPKGIGLLYRKKNLNIPVLLKGGSQENNLRAGTENIGAIASFYKSTQKFIKNRNKYMEKLEGLSKYLKTQIKYLDNFKLNSLNSQNYQSNIVSLYHKHIPGSVILKSLSDKNIFISTGSACSEKNSNLNPVLKSHHYSNYRIKNTIRISFSIFNNKKDINILLENLKQIDASLSSIYKKAKEE